MRWNQHLPGLKPLTSPQAVNPHLPGHEADVLLKLLSGTSSGALHAWWPAWMDLTAQFARVSSRCAAHVASALQALV